MARKVRSPRRPPKRRGKSSVRRPLEVPRGFQGPAYRWQSACEADPPQWPTGDPAFQAARDLATGEKFRLAELQARILADQPGVEIAARMGIPAAVVEVFESWHFDVRDRLEQTGWITHEAVRRCPTGVLKQHDVAAFWRWAGFNYGVYVLEPLLTAVDHQLLELHGIDAYLLPEVPLDLMFKVWIELERTPVPRTAREWKRFQRYQKVRTAMPVDQPADLVKPLVPVVDLSSLLNQLPPGRETGGSEPPGPTAPQRAAPCDFGAASRTVPPHLLNATRAAA